jgi:hypothetical protein
MNVNKAHIQLEKFRREILTGDTIF